MTRVLFITQHFDPAHPLLATTIPQIAALARRVDEVVVLADTIVPDALPPNVRARSFRAPTKIGRGLRFEQALARELPGLRGGAVITHMCPVYTVLAAPLVRPARIPLLLWYVHWLGHVVVRMAEKVATRIVTVPERSFPFPTDKLFTTGQAIDVDSFSEPRVAVDGGPLRVLLVGRYTTAKRADVVLRAVRLALDRGVDLRLRVHGPAQDGPAQAERRSLEALVEELGLGGHVSIGSEIARADFPRLLAEHDAFVNNARGGADRVVYEAAASGLPVLASNPAHSDLLEPELVFGHEDSEELAERLVAMAALSVGERDAIGARLRERVARSHSVDSWAEGLLQAAGLAAQRSDA